MSGWFKLHRGWMDSADFAPEPFTEREAWLWLVENAAYEPHNRYVNGQSIGLCRGDVLASQRTLSGIWKWGRQRVRGFIAKLEHVGSITQNSTHGLTMITICNYAHYQDNQPTEQPSSNPAATQQQPIKEEDKEIKKDKKKDSYAFEGNTIRLTKTDFERWQRAYSAIPDLSAELASLDDWITDKDEAERNKWFFMIGGALKNRHQKIMAERRNGGVNAPIHI